MTMSPRVVTGEGEGSGISLSRNQDPRTSWEASVPLQHARHWASLREGDFDEEHSNYMSFLIRVHIMWSPLGLAPPCWAC